jgi:Spy/CpxP family protein refolding chaperone
MHSRFHRKPLAVAAIAAMLVASTGAFAQGHGPRGHGHHAHHGGPGGQIEQVIARLQSELALNSGQQVMFDNAVAAAKAAREAGRGEFQRVREAMRAELAKAEPDFAAVAAIADQAQANGQAARRQVRDEFLKLYATFTPAQKQVVKDAFNERMARFEKFREKMKERRGAQG